MSKRKTKAYVHQFDDGTYLAPARTGAWTSVPTFSTEGVDLIDAFVTAAPRYASPRFRLSGVTLTPVRVTVVYKIALQG